MKISFSPRSKDDAARQFRYYLLEADAPATAVHFQEAVEYAAQALQQHPRLGTTCPSIKYPGLRSWPVVGFEAIRMYYLIRRDTVTIVRILHGSRDVSRILKLD